MKQYKVMLFDMDGTLADTDPMLVETFNILYDRYKGGNRRPPEEIYYFSGPPIRETLTKEFPEYDLEFMFDVFHKISRKLYDTHIFPYPNERETLLKLKEKGVKLGIVTNKMHDLTLVALKIINLEDIFDVIVGYDDVKIGKPNEEGMLKAINYFGEKIEETLYVGDNVIDLESANNAGVDCCLVSWGPRVLPNNINPTFTIKSYEELWGKTYGKDL